MIKKIIIIIFVLVLFAGFAISMQNTSSPVVTNFEECVAAGNLVMESYPRQCDHNGERFVEDVELPQPVGVEVEEYFSQELERGVLEQIGQPIEGFRPFMFIEVFPKLKSQDFNDVEALLGEYSFVDGGLEFEFVKNQPIHSAAEAITQEGMERLLSNIQKNHDRTVVTTDDVDTLISYLRGPAEEAVFKCNPVERQAEACIEIFQPVCGKINVQCITTPCNPVHETFPNSCFACQNELLESYTNGACLVNSKKSTGIEPIENTGSLQP